MACTTGRGEAQHRKCVQCPAGHFMLKPPMRHGACVALGYDKPREQDAAFYDNPASVCPIGLWDDVEPVDIEAERAASRAARKVAEVARFQPVVDSIIPPGAVAAEDVRKVCVPLIEAGLIMAEASAEIEKNILAERKEV